MVTLDLLAPDVGTLFENLFPWLQLTDLHENSKTQKQAYVPGNGPPGKTEPAKSDLQFLQKLELHYEDQNKPRPELRDSDKYSVSPTSYKLVSEVYPELDLRKATDQSLPQIVSDHVRKSSLPNAGFRLVTQRTMSFPMETFEFEGFNVNIDRMVSMPEDTLVRFPRERPCEFELWDDACTRVLVRIKSTKLFTHDAYASIDDDNHWVSPDDDHHYMGDRKSVV